MLFPKFQINLRAFHFNWIYRRLGSFLDREFLMFWFLKWVHWWGESWKLRSSCCDRRLWFSIILSEIRRCINWNIPVEFQRLGSCQVVLFLWDVILRTILLLCSHILLIPITRTGLCLKPSLQIGFCLERVCWNFGRIYLLLAFLKGFIRNIEVFFGPKSGQRLLVLLNCWKLFFALNSWV